MMSTAEYDGFAVSNDLRMFLLRHGCPACAAPAGEIATRRRDESWRLRFACRARIVGYDGGARGEMPCCHHAFDDRLPRRLTLMIGNLRRRHRRQAGRVAS